MKKITALLFLFSVLQLSAQQSGFPVFPNCENLPDTELEACFYRNLQDFVLQNFSVPENLRQNNYKGAVTVLFEVDGEGMFKVQYVDAVYPELIAEAKRVFAILPKVKPARYNDRTAYAKYTYRIAIPLQDETAIMAAKQAAQMEETRKQLSELDTIKSKTFDCPVFKSRMNIPFSHSYYANFDAELNRKGNNSHTAYKPYTYAEVGKYYDFEGIHKNLFKNTRNWLGRKLWNENFVQFRGEDYWFTLNPVLDLQVGKSSPSDFSFTYQNTRAIQFQGGLGENITFTTTVYESQGRFADYYNGYAESIAPSGGDPAIIPGIGIAKRFKTDAYDFPSAEANISYTPNKFMNIQLGYGRNFIGDGYRSLLLGDAASPYPYFKIHTNFWKFKYTNTYMWLKDVRQEVTEERTYATKFMANHYLSWNISNRFNLGLFESVVWANTNDRGFDINFINPIIFYRTVEFTSSARSGNAVLGATAKFKWSNSINFYGQFLLDEFSLGEIKEQNRSWKNKFGYQIGVKYYDAFTVKNLMLQAEYNHVRPYVYSHSDPITNYGHNNQSLGHPWGGNFRELIGIARYRKGRISADAKLTYGIRGLDFDTTADSLNYGGNIYKNYLNDRPYDIGVTVGQGNKTSIFIADIQAAYLINPSTNLKMFGGLIYRNFSPATETAAVRESSITWLTFGFRTDLFNMYFDY